MFDREAQAIPRVLGCPRAGEEEEDLTNEARSAFADEVKSEDSRVPMPQSQTTEIPRRREQRMEPRNRETIN